MKKNLFCFLFLALMLAPKTGIAQTSSAWTPIFLSANGDNVKHGVEAYFQRGLCGTDEVVYIRFVNTNNYDVILGWYNAVFTQSIEWIHDNDNLVTLTIPALSNNTGSCSGQAHLVVKLADFIPDPAQFKRFTTSQLTVDKVNN